MHSIALTRYNLARFQKADKQRCQDTYVLVKEQQHRLESRGMLKVKNDVLGLAATHFRAGIILQKYNLFGIAADQFQRAHELLALF
ncbi:hypothetical protein [Burkholderia phage FLC9]|nr:hypothetical protein [Burkholderia phage FLC9]